MAGSKYMNAMYQKAVGEFVDREVIYCVSHLVSEIAKDNEEYWHLFRAFDADEARELVRQSIEEDADCKQAVEDFDLEAIAELKEAMGILDIDAFGAENEVYEHWIVSDWLAELLEEKGESVERDFYGLIVWGRCCTGQAILLDRVICDIYDETVGADEPWRKETIARLNDEVRAKAGLHQDKISGKGLIVFTRGIIELPGQIQSEICERVRAFGAFTEDNDPHGERDFGSIEIAGAGKVFWKIDYYDSPKCECGSEDPADPERTFRVLTIMLAQEY